MNCFTIRNAKALWDYAKENIIAKELAAGRIIEFPELTARLAKDVNAAVKAAGGAQTFVAEDMAKLISIPKGVKAARKGLLLQDRVQRQSLQAARDFVQGTEKTPLSKAIRTAYEAPYIFKTIGHGVALHMTHAWPYAFDPATWKVFGSTWWDSLKSMKPENAQRLREQIQGNTRFDENVKGGAAVDPRKVYDDVQKRAGFWGALGRMTENSFLGLKALRQERINSIWDRVPDHLKTEEMNKLISGDVNTMTGASPEVPMHGPVGKFARAVLFAPSLDVARAMRIAKIGRDTGVIMRDALNRVPKYGEQLKKAWGDASPEQKWIARDNMKQWGRIAGVFSGLLYANQLMLKHTFGSKEDINVHDPFKGDWLAYKGPNGRIFQTTGGQIPLVRAATRAVLSPSKAGSTLGDYFAGKINPALSLAKGIITGKGFAREPLPAPIGEKPGTVGNWLAYATAELGPIATEDGIKEFSKQMSDQNGAPQGHNANFLRAIVKAGLVTIPSAVGTHSYQPEKFSKGSQKQHFPKVPQ